MEPGWSLGDGRHPWGVSVKMTFTEGSRSFCYHRECVSWDYYLQATEISFGNLGHNRSCKDCKGMGGSQNGLEGDSQAARLEKDECEVTLGPGRQQLLRGLNWHPPAATTASCQYTPWDKSTSAYFCASTQRPRREQSRNPAWRHSRCPSWLGKHGTFLEGSRALGGPRAF